MLRGRSSWPSAQRSLMFGFSSLRVKFLRENPLISRRAGAIMPRGLSPLLNVAVNGIGMRPVRVFPAIALGSPRTVNHGR